MLRHSSAESTRDDRLLELLALATVATSFFLMLGRSLLFDVDEGAFSQATLEMFQRGDFLSTYLNGSPRYDKPILIYWLQAVSVALFGVHEFAFRLPSAVCAALWSGCIYAFTRRFFGARAAASATIVMAGSVGVYAIGRAATADALLNLLICATMFSAWLHLHTGQRKWLYATHAAIGLGFLAKGPVAILIPLAVTFLFCMMRRDLSTWARATFDWRALLLFALLALPWYAVILERDGWGFFNGFFMRHNVGRFGGPLHGHAGSLVYYVPVVLVGLLPFSALLVLLARRLRALWREDLSCYLLLWFAFVFVFFSLSGTKLPHYMLYGTSGLFVLLGALAAGEARVSSMTLLPALVGLVLLLALPQVVMQLLPRVHDAHYREALAGIDALAGSAYYAVCGAALAVAAVAAVLPRLSEPARLGVAGIAMTSALSIAVVPLAAAVQQAPIREAALLCHEKGWQPIVWGMSAPTFSVYRGAPTPNRDPVAGDIVLTKVKRMAPLEQRGAEVLFRKRGIVLLRMNS